MKAKTSKFLAVLAVLAVAFAGCVILFNEQNDAAEVKEVTKATYPTDGSSIVSIELEETADAKSVVLYTESTEIKSPNAYFFNEDATVSISEKITAGASGKPVMFFVLEGVTLNIVAPAEEDFTAVGLIEFVNVKEYDEESGIITLYKSVAFDNKGYAKPLDDSAVYNAQIASMFYEAEEVFSMTADNKAAKGFTVSGVDVLNLVSSITLTGEIKTVNVKAEDLTVKLKDFTGKIVADGAIMKVSGFTGELSAGTTAITVTKWTAGTLVSMTAGVTFKDNTIALAEGQAITVGKNLAIPGNVTIKFTRYVNDVYTVVADGFVTGSTGTTIKAGENGLEVSGSLVVDEQYMVNEDDGAVPTLKFTGAAKVSGVISANGKAFAIAGDVVGYQVTLEDLRVDNAGSDTNAVKFTGEVVCQSWVTVNGDLVAEGNIIVAPASSLNVTKSFTLGTEDGQNVVFVGKDATLRMKTATAYLAVSAGMDVTYEPMSLTAGSDEWANVAFTDGSGSIFLNQDKVTKTSNAVVSYLYQIGAGTVAINSSAFSTPSTYYIYNQVIPYLSLNPVDVVCTSDIAEKASISLTGVEYTGGEVPIGNQAQYTIDYSTGVPKFTVVFTELYAVSIENAFDDDEQKIAILDKNGEEVDIVQDNVTTTTGIAKLAYGGEYIIKGVNEANKYKFSHDDPMPSSANQIKFERETNYSQSFTMIRAYIYTEADVDEDAPEQVVPGEYNKPVISYEEGFAVELTISLTDSNDKFSEGDVFMYYTTTENNTEEELEKAQAIPVRLGDKQTAVVTGIYTNDYIYLKSEYVLFYKLAVLGDKNLTGIPFFGDDFQPPASADDEVKQLPLDSDSWTDGYEIIGVDPESTTKPWTASFTVECTLDLVDVTFGFVTVGGSNEVPEVTVNFTTYCEESGHKKSVSIKSTDVAAGKNVISMCVGEVYTVDWEEIDGQLSEMTYEVVTTAEVPAPTDTDSEGKYLITVNKEGNGSANANVNYAASGDKVKVTAIPETGNQLKSIVALYGEESLTVTDGEFVMPAGEVTVTVTFEEIDPIVYEKLEVVEAKNARNYTLTFEKIIYLAIENNTDADIIRFTVGDYFVDVEKGKTENLIVNDGLNTGSGETAVKGAPLEVSIIGANVSKWKYQFSDENGEPVQAVSEKTAPVGTITDKKTSGSYEDFVDGYLAEDKSTTFDRMTITDIEFNRIVYYVKVDPIYQNIITYYDQLGYYGTPMVAYLQPEAGDDVYGVQYVYTIDDVEYIEDAVQSFKEGKEYWAYSLPAADVELRPIIAKTHYDVKFVDQTGAQVGETLEVVPFTQNTIDIPAVFGYTATAVTGSPEIEGGYTFNIEAQTVSFEMPDDDVVITVTYTELVYSKDVSVTIGQKGQAINVVLYALDGAEIGAGTITIKVWYTYIDEEGDIMTDSVEVPLTYDVEDKLAYVLTDTTFIQKLGNYYGGAFAVTGTFTLGASQGDIIRTAYTPVEA